LLLIINDFSGGRAVTYEGDTMVKSSQLLEMQNLNICFLDRIDPKDQTARDLEGGKGERMGVASLFTLIHTLTHPQFKNDLSLLKFQSQLIIISMITVSLL
jgi:hypothetical protein